jgi:hypothetical protein
MSLLLMAKAMQTKVGNPLRKLVLIKLADNANDLGECFPSYKHIADQCEISKRSAMSHVQSLCDAGMLVKEERFFFDADGKARNSSNLYKITLPSAGDSLGSAGDSLGGSAGAAPIISNSFEPVNEGISSSKIDYDKIISSYHRLVPTMPAAKVMTDARKKAIKSFWLKFEFDYDKWDSYLEHINENCSWMTKENIDAQGKIHRPRNIDYLITDRCYAATREGTNLTFEEAK